ncbi:amino acid ABC transporter permease [Paracoccus laeviglucosivorans]|uniref:Amino acid ABC transporter membrane protein 2, PAAT family n=1 Tax=Paracoccus laeviglucosivorans TaxID=1197861 RepID=A0A521F101_9RHOB|nr:amino acid ABC transporter permease [Paracoccus laeviglucosivorans]SMO89849.1 amino acid ABC transporter membrane protein 2, PAAT family [Paracoccus laeviglucosivorans]
MLEIIQDYWLTFLIGQYPNGPLGGLAMTLIVAVLSILMSFPIAIGLAVARSSTWRWLRLASACVVNFVRGIPLLMLIFWCYFVIPIMTGYAVSGFWTLVCALTIYEASYLSEVIRAGIASIPKGQTEAARSLGGSYMLTVRSVVLPQALFNVLPGITSQFISTIKETSLGYVIAVNELTFAANQINNQLLTQPLQVFTILAVIYFLLCFLLSRGLSAIETSIRRKRGLL